MKIYVLDTSAIIERIASSLIKSQELSGVVVIPNAVVAELESQANKRKEIGFIGLDELKALQELKSERKIDLKFVGPRPTIDQIKFAKSGEIDALIRQIAYEENATLITADIVQRKSAEAYGLKVHFIEQKKASKKLEIEKYFDKNTMSVHLKEDSHPLAKKGQPGKWELTKIGKSTLSHQKMDELAKEIVEKTRMDPSSFVEISRSGSTVLQYQSYRIVIVRPPISDGLEITAIRPIKKLSLKDYKIQEDLLERLKTKAKGILIAGEVGSGKSTFAQSLAEYYSENGKITKTVESPRDLQVNNNITQYSKNFTSSEEIHDILFLSRPDNIIFDEIRDTPDFKLYTDLRLAGSNCLGVIHSDSAINSIQRFIPRMDTGMIPSVIDTIIYIESGEITEVLTLAITVKTPSGMTEADLARPVIEVFDFLTSKLMYEIYSYGEETIVIPVTKDKTPIAEIAQRQLEKEIGKYTEKGRIEINSANRAILYVPEVEIPKIIGVGGKRIDNIESNLGIRITVKPLEDKKEPISYTVSETKKFITFNVPKRFEGKSLQFSLENKFLFSATPSRKGVIQIHKKSQLGKTLLNAIDNQLEIEVQL